MLQELHIQNLAVIEDTTLSFEKRSTALVGETGAGKSLIVDSLSLLRGAKADFSLVRDPSKKATVSALFRLEAPFLRRHPELKDFVSEEGTLLLKRTLNPDRSSRFYLNDEPVTASCYKNAVLHLVDIHSQGENWDLFDESRHLSYLDRFAASSLASAKKDFQAAYQDLEKERKALEEEKMANAGRDPDYLRFQIQEIDKAKLKPDEIENLQAEYESLRSFERVREKKEELDQVSVLPEGRMSDLLRKLLPRLSSFSDTSLSEPAEKLRSDVESFLIDASAFEEAYHGLKEDPGRIDAINQRLFDLKGLMRKYGKTTGEILKKREEYQESLSKSEEFASFVKEEEKKIAEKEAQALLKARALSALRKEAAQRLSERIGHQMKDLLLPQDGFRVSFQEKPLGEEGIDEVRFEVALNQGLSFAPLAKASSGGEGSRLMLCLKSVLNALDPYDLVVFDEIDTGVSGRIASLVGRKIVSVSKDSQVLLISHLPQVVARAEGALLIEKSTQGGVTRTVARPLDEDGFVQALSGLLSSGKVTDYALKQASLLIQEARKEDA